MGYFLDFSIENSKKENISTFIVEGIKSKVQNVSNMEDFEFSFDEKCNVAWNTHNTSKYTRWLILILFEFKIDSLVFC